MNLWVQDGCLFGLDSFSAMSAELVELADLFDYKGLGGGMSFLRQGKLNALQCVSPPKSSQSNCCQAIQDPKSELRDSAPLVAALRTTP